MSDYIKVFNVQDYALTDIGTGLPIPVGDGVSDDTEVIKAALNAMVAALNPPIQETVFIAPELTLYFPFGDYKISKPIFIGQALSSIRIVGDNAVIRPHANANFVDGDPESPTYQETLFAFQHIYCYDFKMSGMHFAGFEKAVRLFKHYLVDTGRVEVRNCGFQENSDVALELTYNSGIAEILNTKFVQNKIAMDIKAGDKVMVRECWIWSLEGINGSRPASIINSSELVMESCVLVPGKPHDDCVEPAWIKNLGSVTVLETRQGAEEGSFTLINNFAGVDDLAVSNLTDARTVTVKNSQCYAVFGSVYDNEGHVIYAEPAVLRYVDAIPNHTCIESNRGMVLAKIMGFSKVKYNDNTVAIQNAIQASGPAGSITPTNISVKVENNVGALTHANGSHVPTELWDFVRDDNFLWPAKRSNGLTKISSLVSTVGSTDDTIEYTFDYGSFDNVYNTFTKTYLVEYTGNPNISSSVYTGSFIGILRANGSWAGTGTNTRQTLILEPVFNQIGDPASGAYPTGSFTVTAVWDASGTAYLDNTNPNHKFRLKINGRSGPDNVGYDTIKVTALNVL